MIRKVPKPNQGILEDVVVNGAFKPREGFAEEDDLRNSVMIRA